MVTSSARSGISPLPRIHACPVCRPVISAARDGAQTVAAGVVVGEADALAGEAIEARRRELRLAVGAQVAVAEIVGLDEDDVGPGPGLPLGRGVEGAQGGDGDGRGERADENPASHGADSSASEAALAGRPRGPVPASGRGPDGAGATSRQRQTTLPSSIDWPMIAPALAPMIVPSGFERPRVMMLPSTPPAMPPMIRPAVPSSRRQ